MPTIIPFIKARRATTSRRALEQLTAAYARSHHEHESPLVGCYLCLHNVPRLPRELAVAA